MKTTQLETIRARLNKYGYVSNFWAVRNFITYRLGARIHSLRNEGLKIITERRKNKDTFYRLVK